MSTKTNNTLLDLFFDDLYQVSNTYNPASDTYETEKNYNVNLALPGFKKENITLKVEDDKLIISGERKKDGNKKYNLNQTYFGKFEKVFSLPEDINADKITAKMVDGILHVEIPKDEMRLKRRLIDIN